MKLTTQDGRTLELNHKYHLQTWTNSTCSGREKALSITLDGEPQKVASTIRYTSGGKWVEAPSFHWKRDKILDEVVGEFETETSRQKAAEMLNAAWNSGAETFTVPADNFQKSESELIQDICETHKLGMLTLGEPGFTPSEKAWAKRMALTTDYWERRGYLVSDEHGSYRNSLMKWYAAQGNPTPTLQAQVEALSA